MKPALAAYAAVGLGAGLGGIARYAVTLFFVTRFGPGLPLGTFVINMSGSFLIGMISELAQTRAVPMVAACYAGIVTARLMVRAA